MKYMLWSDLEPGDVLQFTDEYLSYFDGNFASKFKNKDLIISKIIYGKDFIGIYSNNFAFPDGSAIINYNGTDRYYKNDLKFKLIKLKEE